MNIRCPSCQTVFRVDPARVPAAGIRARCSRCAETFFVQRDGAGLTTGAPAAPAAPAPQPADQFTPAPQPAARAAKTVPAAAGESAAAAPPRAPQPATPAAAAATAERSGWSAPATAPSAAATASRPAWATPPAAQAAPAPTAAERAAFVAPPRAPESASAAASAAPSFAPPRTQPPPAAPPSAPAAAATEPPRAAAPRPHTFGSRDPDARAKRIARALVSDIIAYHPKRWETSRDAGTLRAEFREEIMKSWEEYVAQVGLELAKSTPHFRTALNDILARGQQTF